MRILFAFENCLPSNEADAEVFVTTARYLTALHPESSLHVPMVDEDAARALGARLGLTIVRAHAPVRPAILRHLCCGLTIVVRRAFRRADLVYTRNLWVAWMALLFGQRVAFDHYRPWPDQIPPLQLWLYRLMRHRRFLINICHSNYTLGKYRALGLSEAKLRRARNGFEPARLQPAMGVAEAKSAIGVPQGQTTVVYTGRLNHKKGLALVVEAARAMPDTLFLLVGSYGQGRIEEMAAHIANIRIVSWQPAETLSQYIFAADILLIPPSWKPLAEFGSTVLPLKLFLYLASGRPILAGDTPDVREVLAHRRNAYLCPPDSVEALVAGITELRCDTALAAALGQAARADSEEFTWSARARTIADLLADRLDVSPPCESPWNRLHYRSWLRQSGRWFLHVLRTRSWVLPPQFQAPEADRGE